MNIFMWHSMCLNVCAFCFKIRSKSCFRSSLFTYANSFFCFILPKYLTPKNTIVVCIRCDCKRWYKTFRSVSGIHIHAHTQFSCLVYNLLLFRLHFKKDAMLSQRKMLPNDFFGLVYFLLNFVLFNSLNLMRERETRVAITWLNKIWQQY